MNLRELHLSDLAVIPGAVDISGGTSQKREQSFHVDEGWDLREVLPGVFSISRADMPHAVTVGGVGYSYVAMPPTHAPPEPLGLDEQGRPWTVQRKLNPERVIDGPSEEVRLQAEQDEHTRQHLRKGKR